ncbi:hypothetical protein CWATWH8502_269 [Crocosphaera watsonii WH 8502]|nr:hypothetical protein CWATWH8502_269 [Crocosphaera watsonii WH 8502]CCQ57529.1 hypothetical protein CWATWH0005_2343 [Crocosphaera watsonii WH 0005]CCQ67872.1 hypothetical protein CWATWH0402_3528 [Crocosphaera watsonii WH 0402]
MNEFPLGAAFVAVDALGLMRPVDCNIEFRELEDGLKFD